MQSSTEQAPNRPAKRRDPAVLLSVAVHLGVLGFALVAGLTVRSRQVETVAPQAVARLEIAGGSHAARITLPVMDIAAHTRHPAPVPEVTKKTILPVQQTPPKISGGGAPPKPHTGDGSGQALMGNGSDNEDARPAFPVFSPRPPVTDRSLLPALEAKIVVDVKVDELGQVVSETLVKGLGNRLDQMVLEIVKTWRFQPATVNGQPVSSESELIFPFNLSYPITVS